MKFNHTEVLIKRMHKARITCFSLMFKSRGSVLSFHILHVPKYAIKYSWGP